MQSLRDTDPVAFAQYMRAKYGKPCDDARIIAAAPDLLAALNAALDEVDRDYAEGIAEPEWAAQARAAIARATGADHA